MEQEEILMSGYFGQIRHSDYLVAVRIKLWTREIGGAEEL